MRAVFTFVTVIFIACVSVTITSFAEVPLWKLETQPPKPHDFLNDDEENVNRLVNDQATASEPVNNDGSDAMAKTTSYGTLSNAKEASKELPRSVRCFVCHFSSTHLDMSLFRMKNVDLRCHHFQRIPITLPSPVTMSPKHRSSKMPTSQTIFAPAAKRPSHHSLNTLHRSFLCRIHCEWFV